MSEAEDTRTPGEIRALVLLEDLQRHMGVILEAVQAGKEELRTEFNARFDQMDRRMSTLEGAVRVNSEDIRGLQQRVSTLEVAVKTNSEDIRGLQQRVSTLEVAVKTNSEDIRGLQQKVDRLAEVVDRKADASRVAALEKRLSA
jgi:chromosome segregation ATPase